MGLDMYLTKKTYVSSDNRGKLSITGLQSKINPERVNYILEEAGYWRKANAIHKWFVDNVQQGEDDCREYYVSQEDLKKLLDTVNKVLDNSKLINGKVHNGTSWKNGVKKEMFENGKIVKDPTIAKELLPYTNGFFFGNTDYDEYYISDLVETKKIIEEALKDTNAEFEYHSSW